VGAELAGGGSGKADVHAACWTLADKTLVLAVNASNQPTQAARIAVPCRVTAAAAAGECIKPVVKALFEDRTCLSVHVEGGAVCLAGPSASSLVVVTEPLVAFGTAAYVISFDGAALGPVERTLPEALPSLCLVGAVAARSSCGQQGKAAAVPTRNLQVTR
jgi:hypothetical protein